MFEHGSSTESPVVDRRRIADEELARYQFLGEEEILTEKTECSVHSTDIKCLYEDLHDKPDQRGLFNQHLHSI